ncbi:hypothetical protein GCU56_10440 [Geodermatophilus sabuli]|uniref:Uncharacterized protein n=1 Tax=Geodermatophilus sabuli TaxID=1564158 RepID=A0A7K3W0Y7_9ACTN|nr:hypothetical protein [Geodermatophilus sabuli]NEK58288.1 hypothetical protein [Geodermatophilus sabuli]
MTAAVLGTGLSARRHHLPAAVAAAAVTALLVLLPPVGDGPGWVGAVAVLQLALVAAWVPATGIPARTGAPALGLAAAAGADLLMVLPERPELGALVAVPGLGLLAVVLHQMLRRAPRQDVVGSMAGVLVLLCAASALAALLRLEAPGAGEAPVTTAVLVVGTTLVVGHLVDSVLPRPPVADGVPCGVPALVLSVLAGAAVALFRHGSGELLEVVTVLTVGLLLGAVAALVGLVAGYVVVGGPGSAWAAPVVQAVLPVAACAPVVVALVLQNAL